MKQFYNIINITRYRSHRVNDIIFNNSPQNLYTIIATHNSYRKFREHEYEYGKHRITRVD